MYQDVLAPREGPPREGQHPPAMATQRLNVMAPTNRSRTTTHSSPEQWTRSGEEDLGRSERQCALSPVRTLGLIFGEKAHQGIQSPAKYFE